MTLTLRRILRLERKKMEKKVSKENVCPEEGLRQHQGRVLIDFKMYNF